jgi:hypothetical protein
MEVGYVREMDFIVQHRNSNGEDFFERITAGSEKHARKKMQQKMHEASFSSGKVVCNLKANGDPGELGDGLLPNTEETRDELVKRFSEDE